MAKYVVWATASAYKKVGEYEADSEEDAVEMSMSDPLADSHFGLNIGNDFDVGDAYEWEAEEIK